MVDASKGRRCSDDDFQPTMQMGSPPDVPRPTRALDELLESRPTGPIAFPDREQLERARHRRRIDERLRSMPQAVVAGTIVTANGGRTIDTNADQRYREALTSARQAGFDRGVTVGWWNSARWCFPVGCIVGGCCALLIVKLGVLAGLAS